MGYVSIAASIDPAKVRLAIKIISVASFTISLGLFLFISVTACIVTIIIFNLSTAMSILNYGKRDIIRLTSPRSSLKGMLVTVKTLFSKAFDLIIAPMFTMFVVIDLLVMFGYESSILATGTIMFVIMTLVQLSPIRLRKDHFTRRAHKNISQSLDNITVSRCMRDGIDRRTKYYRKYLRYQVSAEASIRVDSQFLMLSSGMRVMVMSAIRFVMPIAGTVAPLLLRELFLVI